jgi:hypothetical protein
MKTPLRRTIGFFSIVVVLALAVLAVLHWNRDAKSDLEIGGTNDPDKESLPIVISPSLPEGIGDLIDAGTWKSLTSGTYTDYIRRLRELGFPEDTIRAIVISDINAHFAGRHLSENPFEGKEVPYWVTGSSLRAQVQDWLISSEKSLHQEKRAMARNLLGAEVDFGAPRTTYSAAELNRHLLGFLGKEKSERIGDILMRYENEYHRMFSEESGLIGFDQERDAAYARFVTERERVLGEHLSVEEKELLDLRVSDLAEYLRFKYSGNHFTPDQFREIFRTAKPHELALDLRFIGSTGDADRLAIWSNANQEIDRQVSALVKGPLNRDFRDKEKYGF